MIRINTLLIVILCIMALTACQDHNHTKRQTRIITVAKTPVKRYLYFNSVIAPNHLVNLSSPVAGIINKVSFSYGTLVEKGQNLFIIESAELAKQYQQALTNYIEKREAWNNSQLKFKGIVDLNKEGIITRNEFNTEMRANNDTYMAFLQSQWSLEATLKLINDGHDQLKQLIFSKNFLEQKHLFDALTTKTNFYYLTAPEKGIALLPLSEKETHGVETSGKSALVVGDNIKANETLLTIGDLNSIKLAFNIDEINLSHLKLGQAVAITSIAFPTITLHGEIATISNQAQTNSSGGLPSFPVTVVVKQIPEKIQKIIHVGNSAKIQVTIAKTPSIQVPINAVYTRAGENYLQKISPETGQAIDQPVATGETSETLVTILNGLNPGDKIVVPD